MYRTGGWIFEFSEFFPFEQFHERRFRWRAGEPACERLSYHRDWWLVTAGSGVARGGQAGSTGRLRVIGGAWRAGAVPHRGAGGARAATRH